MPKIWLFNSSNYLLLIAGTFKSTKSVRGGPGPIMRNGRKEFENKTKQKNSKSYIWYQKVARN